MFHHVLIRAKVLDAGRPVFVEVQPTDRLPRPSSETYRVLRSPIPHGGDFCLVTLENERFCSFGVEHVHQEDWADPDPDELRSERGKAARG